MQLNPYLLFKGNCREAMTFYQTILGGKLTMQTFGESGMPTDEKTKDQIIHALLDNSQLTFMASDGGSATENIHIGDNVAMSISGTEEEKLTEFFKKLAEGGKINMPFEKQFWGDTFGMLTDKFGIKWMVNVEMAK